MKAPKGQKAVRLDKNTVIYVKQHVDEKALIERFKNRKLDPQYEYLDSYEKLGNKPIIRMRTSR